MVRSWGPRVGAGEDLCQDLSVNVWIHLLSSLLIYALPENYRFILFIVYSIYTL